MQAQLNIGLRAAREGAIALVRSFDRLDRVKANSDSIQQQLSSTRQDIETVMLDVLTKAYPKHGYLSATTDLTKNGSAETVWLLSPLIGVENFLRGSPGILLGLSCRVRGQMVLAVFIDPLLNEEFTASRGNGASLNGRRIRVSNRSELEDGLIGVAYNGTRNQAGGTLDVHSRLLEGCTDLRSSGNEILDILYVAAARLDGGFVGKPEPCSLNGAGLILQEAGGLLSDANGDPTLKGNTLVFGNPKCFKQLLRLLG